MKPALRAISTAMSKASPVFIVGVPRCGTTALRHTLDQHPVFRAKRDLSPETSLFARPQRLFKLRQEVGRRPWRYLLEDEPTVRALEECLGAQVKWTTGWRRWLLAAFGDADGVPARVRRWRIQGRDHQLRAYFYFAAQVRGCQRLLEKTPRHVHFLPEIFATFPGAQILVCVRHPVEVFSSLRKRLARSLEEGREPDRGGWQRVDLDEFVSRYARIAEIALRCCEARPQQCRLVRYETLTADPPAELASICTYLGEAFDQAALLGGREVQRDVHGSPDPRARLASNYKNWNDFVTADDARRIEAGLVEPMRRLGYAPLARIGD